jgi:hypothetical protein
LRVKIECLEEENERLANAGEGLERDALTWGKDNRLRELETELEVAYAELEILRGTRPEEDPHKLTSYTENDMYPDILPSEVDTCEELASLRSVIHALEKQNLKLCEKVSYKLSCLCLLTLPFL